MSTSQIIDEFVANYSPVDTSSEPDFSHARLTHVVLTAEDELQMRIKVGQVIEAGNKLSGYTRKELTQLCDIKTSQFSKIVKGEAWLNLDNLGLWGFATGITPAEVVQLAPLQAPPSVCISWFINGRLHHLDHDEFDLFTKLICRRLGLRHERVNVSGDEPIPKLKDKDWQNMYQQDLSRVVSKRVKQLRDQLKLSQKAFGDILGVTPETIKRYESEKVRANGGVYAIFRLYATTTVSPVELTRGSIHHKLRYVQEQRQLTLLNITKQLDSKYYKQLKDITLSLAQI